MYFRLGKLQRVSTHVQQMWGIIGHVTVEAGSPVGTDGAPPQGTLSMDFNFSNFMYSGPEIYLYTQKIILKFDRHVYRRPFCDFHVNSTSSP
jgi:hypothetical protein